MEEVNIQKVNMQEGKNEELNTEHAKLVSNKKLSLGLVTRCYAKNLEQARKYKERVKTTIESGLDTGLYDSIYILIPIDHDSGDSQKVIQELLDEEKYDNVQIILARGYHSREAENVALTKANQDGVTHITYISNKANCYLDKDITMRMINIFKSRDDTKEVGVAVDSDYGKINMEGDLGINEISHGEFIGLGFAQNTYNTWEVESLLQVGGFDPWQHDGCEEVVPQYRISIAQASPCLEVIIPDNNKNCDIGNTERHKEVLENKWTNTKQELGYLGLSPKEFINTTFYKVNK
jgi:hypothetical protein